MIYYVVYGIMTRKISRFSTDVTSVGLIIYYTQRRLENNAQVSIGEKLKIYDTARVPRILVWQDLND